MNSDIIRQLKIVLIIQIILISLPTIIYIITTHSQVSDLKEKLVIEKTKLKVYDDVELIGRYKGFDCRVLIDRLEVAYRHDEELIERAKKEINKNSWPRWQAGN